MDIIILPYQIFFHKNEDAKATNVKRQAKAFELLSLYSRTRIPIPMMVPSLIR